MEFQLSSIIRAKRDSELIQKRFVPVCGIAAIHGNNGSCKPKLSQQGAVSVIAVESGVSQESIITQSRMSGEKNPGGPGAAFWNLQFLCLRPGCLCAFQRGFQDGTF